MPTYTYQCPSCGDFEFRSSMSDYKNKVKCPKCKKLSPRNVLSDAESTIVIGDSSPKTVGAMAERNADKLSADEKHHLNKKHNAYKEQDLNKPLPPGMERIQKPSEKPSWSN